MEYQRATHDVFSFRYSVDSFDNVFQEKVQVIWGTKVVILRMKIYL